MPFRQTIAGKIFGLAIILLLLTIAFLNVEVARTKQDLTVVADFDVPLTKSLGQMDEADSTAAV
jgi:hypothetical protein